MSGIMVDLNAGPVVPESGKHSSVSGEIQIEDTLLTLRQAGLTFLVCRGDRDRDSLALSLGPLCFCFLLFSLETSSPSGDPVTVRSRLSQITLNWLSFKILREYFWNMISCLHIAEPGPNLRQNKWHFVQEVLLFFRTYSLLCFWL